MSTPTPGRTCCRHPLERLRVPEDRDRDRGTPRSPRRLLAPWTVSRGADSFLGDLSLAARILTFSSDGRVGPRSGAPFVYLGFSTRGGCPASSQHGGLLRPGLPARTCVRSAGRARRSRLLRLVSRGDDAVRDPRGTVFSVSKPIEGGSGDPGDRAVRYSRLGCAVAGRGYGPHRVEPDGGRLHPIPGRIAASWDHRGPWTAVVGGLGVLIGQVGAGRRD